MKRKNPLKQYPVLTSLAAALCPAFLLCLISMPSGHILYSFTAAMLIGLFCLYPFVLTALNLFFCFKKYEDPDMKPVIVRIETVTLALGLLFSLLLLCVVDIDFTADWPQILNGSMVHTPIWTKAYPTVFTFLGIGIAGYSLLRGVCLSKLPPLAIVAAFSATYLGMFQCMLWIIQTFTIDGFKIYLCLLPLNWIVICIRLMREKILEWKIIEDTEKRTFDPGFLEKLNQKVMDSGKWPLWAFFFIWPLAGLGIMILALFGQRPDNLIRAWTETSQWNLSAQVSPPNIVYDQHYLCTVAAGGHKKLVKPLRMGVRHGHKVVVNRQLCIANAFEQILQERLPKTHKKIRRFYDAYGFPIAAMIRSPWAADMIYLVMKPLEWGFLTVLYLTDARPEDRIRMQYIPPLPFSTTCQKAKKPFPET